MSVYRAYGRRSQLSESNLYEQQLLWFEAKAVLLEIHDNVAAIIERYCIEVLVRLELYDKAAELRSDVLAPARNGDYGRALDNLRNFVLTDPAMYRLFPQLIDNAEPGLDALRRFSGEFEIT